MRTTACGTVAIALAGAAAAFAQAPPVMLHLTVAGPAAWRARLGPTNLGTMLATSQAEAIWRRQIDEIDAALRSKPAAARDPASRSRFLDYGGEAQLVVWLEQAEDAVHLRRWSAALIVAPDGHTDLAAMVAECDDWLGRTGASSVPAWLEMKVQPPVQHDSRVVVTMACAEDSDAVAARAKAFAGLPLGDAVLRLDVEIAAALGMLRDRPAEREFVAALLGPATTRATVEVRNVGPQVAVDFTVGFGDGERGVLGGLCPAATKVADLARFVPADTATHWSWPFDAAATWTRAVDAFAISLDDEPKAMHARLAKRLGADVARDVLPLLDKEALLLWRSVEQDDSGGPFANVCLVVPVRDEPALTAAMRAVLLAAAERPVVDDDGLRCSSSAWSLAIGSGVLCVGFGSAAARHCEAVIERAAEQHRPDAEPPPPGVPAGYNGRGRIDVTTLLERDLRLRWLPLFIGARPTLERVASDAERWAPLLREHGLGHAVTAAGAADKAWRLRVLW